ncbi:MAG: Fe2+-dependent dioxygenase [Alphaproteobacteria bacterium]
MALLDAVLRPGELAEVLAAFEQGEFVDGRETAGALARRVKRNRQLKKTPEQADRLNRLIGDALWRDPGFQRFALPRRIAPPLLSRYGPGMEYGWHVDDALMRPGGQALRTDLSVTIFLNDPGDYDGGALVLEGAVADEEVKLPRGSAVVYPSTSLHRVAPVERGERLVAVTWVESHVRDDGRRELLADLAMVRDALTAHGPGPLEAAADRSCKAYNNLLRRWADS